MPNYAIIENNKITNVIVADSKEIAIEVTGKEVLETTGQPWIDWTLSGNTWLEPVEEEMIDAELVQSEIEAPVKK